MSDLSGIRLLAFDVDGVLTDGGIVLDDLGRESKRFHVRDGLAMVAAMRVGLKVGVISGRASRVVSLRMADLGVSLLLQGVPDKAVALETLCQQAGVLPEEAAFVGDDLVDLPALLRCGYPVAVADAAAEVRQVARHVTRAAGGQAAAREVIEHVLRSQGRWEQVLEHYGL